MPSPRPAATRSPKPAPAKAGDAAGNMLSKLDGTGTTRTLTWDAENKLTKAQINAATYEYTYGI